MSFFFYSRTCALLWEMWGTWVASRIWALFLVPTTQSSTSVHKDGQTLHRWSLQARNRNLLCKGLVPSLALSLSQWCQLWVSPCWPGSFHAGWWGFCHPSTRPRPALRSPRGCSACSQVALSGEDLLWQLLCPGTLCTWGPHVGKQAVLTVNTVSLSTASSRNQMKLSRDWKKVTHPRWTGPSVHTL